MAGNGSANDRLERFMERVAARNPNEDTFLQAVREVAADILEIAEARDDCRQSAVLDRLAEPDRTISFRVVWEADDGAVMVNRGYRVQFSNAIGAYKGGLRFHPSVNPSVLKFLGFEQTFKNALTGLPMGGAKGGSDFDPSGRSEREIMRFCQAFMTELHRHIGPDIDVPAGDINVGPREIGFLFGAYKRITGEFEGSLTGKAQAFGGSAIRVEATGFGLVRFLKRMLERHDETLEGKTVVVSGAGNVATHAAEAAIHEGATVIALSDSRGTLVRTDGFDTDAVAAIRRHKNQPGARLSACADELDAEWRDGATPWQLGAQIALPSATENELDADDAKTLAENGCIAIAEGANMPLTAEAVEVAKQAGILFGPAKAANAGGVAVSGIEISQNALGLPRTANEVQRMLNEIMASIHDAAADAATRYDKVRDGRIDYAAGANIAGFEKLADALLAQGLS